MDKHLKKMLNEVFFFNLVVGIFLGILIQIIFKNHGLMCILGVFIASLSYTISGLASNYLISKTKGLSILIYFLSYIIRIFLITYIGYTLYGHDIFDAAAYLFGYTCSFIGIFIYTFKNSNLEERK